MDSDNCVKYFGATSKEIVANYKSLKLTPKEMVLILGVFKYGYIFIENSHDFGNIIYELTSLGAPKELFTGDSNKKITFSDKDIVTIKNRIVEIKRRSLWKD